MTPSPRNAILALAALCLTGTAFAQIPMDDPIVGDAVADHRPLLDPMFAMTENQSNLTGFLSDVTTDSSNYCFAGTPDTTFTENEVVAVNIFFDDTVEADQFNQYQVTWALRLRGNIVPVATFACDVDLSGYSPGEAVTLCCAVTQLIPASPLPIPITITPDWGARVIKSENAFTVQGILGSATVTR
ncbi:MAG: hypothetical protein PVF68_11160 [Acidobacteriota bacterium]|jgi:hypothetical protein